MARGADGRGGGAAGRVPARAAALPGRVGARAPAPPPAARAPPRPRRRTCQYYTYYFTYTRPFFFFMFNILAHFVFFLFKRESSIKMSEFAHFFNVFRQLFCMECMIYYVCKRTHDTETITNVGQKMCVIVREEKIIRTVVVGLILENIRSNLKERTK